MEPAELSKASVEAAGIELVGLAASPVCAAFGVSATGKRLAKIASVAAAAAADIRIFPVVF